MEQNEGAPRISNMEISKISGLIRVIRAQRVMLDVDLAGLYGVETNRRRLT